MRQDLSTALDESLALLMEGQVALEECLDRYPEQEAELRPLLEVFLPKTPRPHPTHPPHPTPRPTITPKPDR